MVGKLVYSTGVIPLGGLIVVFTGINQPTFGDDDQSINTPLTNSLEVAKETWLFCKWNRECWNSRSASSSSGCLLKEFKKAKKDYIRVVVVELTG